MISLIVAIDEDYLIGKKDSSNGMPWSNKEDLKHFKDTTINKSILMGSTTYKAIGKPLPNRKTIVVSKRGFEDNRVEIVSDLEKTIAEYRLKNEDLYIAGGASIYKQSLPLVDQLLISKIPGKHQGETYFPRFESYGFKLVEIKKFETFNLEIYRKDK